MNLKKLIILAIVGLVIVFVAYSGYEVYKFFNGGAAKMILPGGGSGRLR